MWYHYIEENENENTLFIYLPHFLNNEDLKLTEDWLYKKKNNNEFKEETRNYNSKTINNIIDKRKQLWFQHNNEYFCNKWKKKYERWKSNKYDEELINIENIISNKLKEYIKLINERLCIGENVKLNINKNLNLDTTFNFNSSLINYYENGNQFISPHKDSIDSFGIYPTIACLSIGISRTMIIQRLIYNNNIKSLKKDNSKDGINLSIPLENNSLFLMMGSSQKYYTHEIIKEPNITRERFSITMRKWQG